MESSPPSGQINGHGEVERRVRSRFLAGVNHDLRTPLNAVIGFAQIIESEMFGKIENPQYLEYIKHIQDSGQELLTKIEDLCVEASAGMNGNGYHAEEEPAEAYADEDDILESLPRHLAAAD